MQIRRLTQLSGLALALTLPLTATLASAQEQVEPSGDESFRAEAIEVAQAYIDTIKQKKPVDGLKRHWSFEALCTGIFGEDYQAMSAEDQTTCAETMRSILVPALTDPQISEAMSGATYSDFEATGPKDGKVRVNYTFLLAMEGATSSTAYLWVGRVDGALKLVDMANGEPQAALTIAIGSQWQQYRESMSPLDYVRRMAQGG